METAKRWGERSGNMHDLEQNYWEAVLSPVPAPFLYMLYPETWLWAVVWPVIYVCVSYHMFECTLTSSPVTLYPPALNYCLPWCAGTSLGNPWGCWEEKAGCGAQVRFFRAGCRQGILFLSINIQGQRWQKRIKRLWLRLSHYVGTGVCLNSS